MKKTCMPLDQLVGAIILGTLGFILFVIPVCLAFFALFLVSPTAFGYVFDKALDLLHLDPSSNEGSDFIYTFLCMI